MLTEIFSALPVVILYSFLDLLQIIRFINFFKRNNHALQKTLNIYPHSVILSELIQAYTFYV